MKNVLKTLLLVLLVTLSQITSAQDGRVLNIPYVYQVHLCCWCWAASSNMIIRYYNNDVDLCEVVEYARTKNPSRFGTQNCCSTPTPNDCIKTNYIDGSTNGGITDILLHWGISNELISRPYTLTEIRTEIDNDRPFMFQWCPSGCHTMVGRGYEDDNIYVINPGDGYHVYNYDWLVEQGTGSQVWDYTHRLFTNPPCGDATTLFTTPINADITAEETNTIEIGSTIDNNSNVILMAGNVIILQPGFTIKKGSTLKLETNLSLGCP